MHIKRQVQNYLIMASLSNLAKKAGVIGAGGAGFPTHVKLENPVDTIVVNGAECEPLMHGDQLMMETKTKSILSALKKVADEFKNKKKSPIRVVIGIKEKYKEAINAFRFSMNGYHEMEILELPNVYPAGDEQFLVYEATGRVTPEGGIPPMVNALVLNVGTLVHLADAINKKPVTERVVTLGGAVERPRIVSLPIGTSFSEIILKVRPTVDDYVILVNGPMMGRVTEDLSEVTTKTMGGFFLLPKKHSYVSRMRRPLSTEIKLSKSVCEVCRYCTDFCPRYLQGHKLEPHKIMRVINYDRDLDNDTITSAWLCCECGVCDLWACPMFLSPRVIFREFKKRLKEAGIKNPHNRTELEIDPYRNFRGIPTDRLVTRLGLNEYDIRPPSDPEPWSVDIVKILLDTHTGAVALPVVSVGDTVHRGDLIADIPKGKLGAKYHASIDGVVMKVTERSIIIEKGV